MEVHFALIPEFHVALTTPLAPVVVAELCDCCRVLLDILMSLHCNYD